MTHVLIIHSYCLLLRHTFKGQSPSCGWVVLECDVEPAVLSSSTAVLMAQLNHEGKLYGNPQFLHVFTSKSVGVSWIHVNFQWTGHDARLTTTFFWERLFEGPAGTSFQSGSSRSTWVHLCNHGAVGWWRLGTMAIFQTGARCFDHLRQHLAEGASVGFFCGNRYGIFEHQSE